MGGRVGSCATEAEGGLSDKIEVRSVPFLDTGLGREAGYASDREFIEAWEAELAKMSPAERAFFEEDMRRLTRKFVLGDSA